METEEEQVEKLKKWWQENGRSVIAGIVIGVGGLFGYRYWVDLNEAAAERASNHFIQMIVALEASDYSSVNQQADILLADYSSTEYAIMARFARARSFVNKEEYGAAQQELEQIIGKSGQDPLAFLARKRLAAIQLQTISLEQALATLGVEFPRPFRASVEELKGDIYARQGKLNEAADAYRKAQRGTPGPSNATFLQQKLDDLGATG
ncbi:MAG: tetratricopeptide repeat protein [Proteobacteria bacterium]|nr:tetratricopeptide repeat protein [Pseudomonadota bacterium]